MGYQPYLVAPLTTGISKYLKPWMQQEDALTDMEDCYTYRGVVQKRWGYDLYDKFPSSVGIYFLATADGATLVYNGIVPYQPVGKKSLQISHVDNTGILRVDGVDNGAGVISGTNIAAGSTINYATGAISITFTAAPKLNTAIKVSYGVKIAVGDGVTTNFTPNLNSVVAGLPIKERSVFIKNTATAQSTPPTFDIPNNIGTIGDLTNPGQVSSGTVTYATGSTNFTFVTPPPIAAVDQDIWAQWEFQAVAQPIKGIKFFWSASSLQDTLVFNNTEAAKVDSQNFKLTNISGPNYFSVTTQSNFYSVANYQGKAFILNNDNRLTAWDGTSLIQPIVSFNSATPLVNELTTGLFVFLYKNRLVVLRPIETNTVKPQRARYSALNDPFTWYSDVQGKGGFIDAPTAEWIVSAEFLGDDLIVEFQKSTWRLRYTAVDVAPYRWEKINVTRQTSAPYGTVAHQDFTNSVGLTGLIRCDGANVDRYDDKIIDFTRDEINQDGINLCNGYRNDIPNQQYISYQSKEEVSFCDKWLVWNFLENNFAKWNIPSTTFGSYFQRLDLAWQDFIEANNLDYAWQDFQDQNWFAYFSQGNAEIPMFGDKDGNVYKMPVFGLNTDNGTKTGFTFTTMDFNPFVKQGQRCVLGYVDFYFDRPSAFPDFDPNYLISIDFYMDENPDPISTVILNPSEDNWNEKRVFVNNNAQFHRFRIYLSDDQIANSTATQSLILNGWIWWAQPGGRISGV